MNQTLRRLKKKEDLRQTRTLPNGQQKPTLTYIEAMVGDKQCASDAPQPLLF